MYFQEKGYTLIEAIAVISIISLMAGVFFVGFLGRSEERALQLSANRLLQDLRVIQDRALAPLPHTEKETLCRMENPLEDKLKDIIFGIYFEMGEENYKLFVDCEATKEYNEFDKVVNPIGLERGIEIKSLKIGTDTHPQASVVFVPPHPEVYINGEKGNSIEVTISIKGDEEKTRVIMIHQSGLVEIKEK